jgi:hypothetical protein
MLRRPLRLENSCFVDSFLKNLSLKSFLVTLTQKLDWLTSAKNGRAMTLYHTESIINKRDYISRISNKTLLFLDIPLQ